jgi:hypothetical protein
MQPFSPKKKKPRGRPFTGTNDPRRQNGRTPKVLCIPDILKKICEREVPEVIRNGLKMPWLQRDAKFLEALMEIVMLRAMQGDSWAVQFIAERTEGKVRDTLAIQNDDGPLVVVLAPDAPDGK